MKTYNDFLKKLEIIEKDIIHKNEVLKQISETACLLNSDVADSVVGVCPHCIACNALGIGKERNRKGKE